MHDKRDYLFEWRERETQVEKLSRETDVNISPVPGTLIQKSIAKDDDTNRSRRLFLPVPLLPPTEEKHSFDFLLLFTLFNNRAGKMEFKWVSARWPINVPYSLHSTSLVFVLDIVSTFWILLVLTLLLQE